jgi:CRISPR system Cascade subunit CasE
MSGQTLRMLRLEPDMPKVARWGLARGVARPGFDDGYFWHALLKATFGELAPKPFRLVEPSHGRPYLVGYHTADKEALLDRAKAFAEPDAAEAIGLHSLAVKDMPTKFKTGVRLGFETRVRPVVRTTRNDPVAPGREIDVFLAAAISRRDEKLDRGLVYTEWLKQELAKGGASIEPRGVKLVSVRRARLLRRGAADGEGHRPLRQTGKKGGGPDLVMAGELTVSDPLTFHDHLARGIGRHRAFGFGMLLLRPPRTRTGDA